MAVFQPVTPDPKKILITDVSFYQIDIDFKKMKSEGVSGTIIRAGQRSWIDTKFKQNWKLAKEAGLPRGSYWYYDNRENPKNQAELYVSVFEGDFAEMGLWADFEDRTAGAFKGWDNWYIFMNRIIQLVPNVKLGFYSNYYYATEFLPSPTMQRPQNEWFTQFDFWVASYQVGQTPVVPKMPRLFSDYKLHQFTDNLDGKKYGVQSYELDGNYFNGTQEEFNKFCGIKTPSVEIPLVVSSHYPAINSLEILTNDGKRILFYKEIK